jgi:hypothetical protein
MRYPNQNLASSKTACMMAKTTRRGNNETGQDVKDMREVKDMHNGRPVGSAPREMGLTISPRSRGGAACDRWAASPARYRLADMNGGAGAQHQWFVDGELSGIATEGESTRCESVGGEAALGWLRRTVVVTSGGSQ